MYTKEAIQKWDAIANPDQAAAVIANAIVAADERGDGWVRPVDVETAIERLGLAAGR